MKAYRHIMTPALLALCLALFASSALAQTITTGSIEGTVIDQDGAAVPGVTVNVTSLNLIQPQSAISDVEGRYHILNLPPGRYTVTVEAAGASPSSRRRTLRSTSARLPS